MAEIVETTSEVRRGEETVVIWNLKGWKENHALLQRATCSVDVYGDSSSGSDNVKAQLCFYFKKQSYLICAYGRASVSETWLDLFVDEVSNHEDKILQYDIKVDHVAEKGNADGRALRLQSVEKTTELKKMEESGAVESIMIQKKYFKLRTTSTNSSGANVELREILPLRQPADLRLKISVTPIYIATASSHHDPAGDTLNKKMIGICNQENMTRLYRTAQTNGSQTAKAEISKFIRERYSNFNPGRNSSSGSSYCLRQSTLKKKQLECQR